MRWSTESRLEFIEFRLYWEGGVNRADITSKFGVSVPQASKDLSQYQALAPENLRYDSSEKRYVCADQFRPQFLRLDSDRYLRQLQSIGDGTIGGEDTWITHVPAVDVMPIPHRRVDPELLRAALAAVRAHRSVEIRYQSMNPERPAPAWRRVTPHAFGFDGFRWHLRAFCHIDGRFKDFLVSRCLGIRGEDVPGASPESDQVWVEHIDVQLVPNPQLAPSQQQVIEFDYGMQAGVLHMKMRLWALYYFIKRLRLDVVAHMADRPQEAPLVLKDPEEVEKFLHRAQHA